MQNFIALYALLSLLLNDLAQIRHVCKTFACKISVHTLKIVKENIVFALAIKAICLVLGALGIANMWVAIFADVGVMILAVLNAIRALKIK